MNTLDRRLAPRWLGWRWRHVLRAGLLALSGLVLSSIALVYVAFVRGPAHPPRAVVQRGRLPTTQRLVVAAGASSTHASLSADYVALVRQQFGATGYEVVNAGRNGDTSGDLLRRIDAIVACQPDVVTILIGTNDVRQALRTGTGPDTFRTNVDQLLHQLQTRTTARIALLSLPPLGEDTASAANQLVREYNQILQQLAAEHGVTYLPVHEALVALLADATDHQPQPYAFRPQLLVMAALRRYVLRQGWDAIGQAHGQYILTDHIHLTDRSAAVLADRIGTWLRSSESPVDE